MSQSPTYLQYAAEGVPIPWSTLLSDLAGWYLWALLFPLIYWAAHRFPFELQLWRSRLAIHTLVGLAVSACYSLLTVLKVYLIIAIRTRDYTPHVLTMGPGYWLSTLHLNFLVYCVAIAVVHAFDYYRKYEERELKATRLEAKLAQAQLQVLRMQLHPHFLFNTLHAISALMHKNVDAADRMITLLSDFLRLSLDNAGRQEVTLQRELDFLDRYVEIEKTRFGDRLAVEIQVDSGLLDAKVPNLILQPLVENAVRHGISLRSAPGKILVRARSQFPRKLELQVLDNGPGIAEGVHSLQPGVGLSNTKARLEQLYGDAHDFEVGNGDLGGFMVTVTIPHRTEAEESGTDVDAQEGLGKAAPVAAATPSHGVAH